MSTSPIILSPKPIAPELFTDAAAAVAYVEEIYERNIEFLRNLFEAYGKSERIVGHVRATYPFVRVTATSYAPRDSRLSYGFVAGAGVHETTVTRPNLFRAYLTEQIGLLIENHGVAVEIGESEEPIPIHFAYRRDINIEAGVSMRSQVPSERPLREVFDTPDLAAMDDAIVNGILGGAGPTRNPPDRQPQMPAFHLTEPGCGGITMINIGTGPSNARNITDHVACGRMPG